MDGGQNNGGQNDCYFDSAVKNTNMPQLFFSAPFSFDRHNITFFIFLGTFLAEQPWKCYCCTLPSVESFRGETIILFCGSNIRWHFVIIFHSSPLELLYTCASSIWHQSFINLPVFTLFLITEAVEKLGNAHHGLFSRTVHLEVLFHLEIL